MEKLNTESILYKIDKTLMIKHINDRYGKYPNELKDAFNKLDNLTRPFKFIKVDKFTNLYNTPLCKIKDNINIFEYTEYSTHNKVGKYYKRIEFSFMGGYKQNENKNYPTFYDYNTPFNQCKFKVVWNECDSSIYDEGYSMEFEMLTIDDCPYNIYVSLGNINIEELEIIVSNIFNECFISHNSKLLIIDLEFLCDYFTLLNPNADITCG